MCMTVEEFRALPPEQRAAAYRSLPAEEKRQLNADLDQFFQQTFNEVVLQHRLQEELVPTIQFKKPTPAVEYPDIPPARQGIDQEEYVRRIFRSDPLIKELRTADGNIYTRK
jgi:hypothetical protein